MRQSPGVFYQTKFVFSGSFTYQSFLEYMDRENARRPEQLASYNLFHNYMGNPEKTSGLFSVTGSYLNEDEKQTFKQQFINAQEKDTIMWQHLFSFTDEWLRKNGMMDPKTRAVDEVRVMEAVRVAMNTIESEEKLQGHIWLGAMHHNTKHIHVHVSAVEREPSREWGDHKVYAKNADGHRYWTGDVVYEPKGKMSKDTLAKTKQRFVGQLVDMKQELASIDNLIRKTIVEEKKSHTLLRDKDFQQDLARLYVSLPNDKRKWNYKNAKDQKFKYALDQLSDRYVAIYHPETKKELDAQLGRLAKHYEETYNSVTFEDIKKKQLLPFQQNREQDLKKQLGNAMLQDIKLLEQVRSQKGISRKQLVQALFTPKVAKETDSPYNSEQVEKAMAGLMQREEKTEVAPTKKGGLLNDEGKRLVLEAGGVIRWKEVLPRKPSHELNRNRDTAPITSKQQIDQALEAMPNRPTELENSSEKTVRPSAILRKGGVIKNGNYPDYVPAGRRMDMTDRMARKAALPEKAYWQKRREQSQARFLTNQALHKVSRTLDNRAEKWKNQRAFEQLEEQVAQQHANSHRSASQGHVF
ncbi:hypothetical protein HCJ57_15795 [Listeria booriae]|uniref:MobP2 family relaxase n=1 Tax=Listeria booriae TaxID=1552123 RepID=UPI001627F46C|nr:MobP2 family relaxase [Listeria booriae]MBC2057989.1 hypothetical protein [Listeria booriae]